VKSGRGERGTAATAATAAVEAVAEAASQWNNTFDQMQQWKAKPIKNESNMESESY